MPAQRLLARARQGADEGDTERARTAESGTGGRVTPGGEREPAQHREHPQCRHQQRQLTMSRQAADVRAFERLPQVLRHKPQQRSTELQLDVDVQPNRAVDHDPTLARRERCHVGPAAGEVEPHRRARVNRGRKIAPPHGSTCHVVTVGNSPRMSMRTPRTRRLIAWTPLA